MSNFGGYAKQAPTGRGTGNSRNGRSRKTLKGEIGEVAIRTPRDRNATFEPPLIGKGQRRLTRFDGQILSLYARGMTTRDIADTFEERYGAEVSHSLIAQVTEAVWETVQAWQSRPLDEVYPIIYLDGLVVKVHHEAKVLKKTMPVALGVNLEGQKEVLGLWLAEQEGAKFWMNVLTELQNRGLKDLFIACGDGLTGFPEAIQAVYPQTQVQLCIVHLVRNALNYVADQDRKAVATDLKRIYRAATLAEAERALEDFAERWDAKYPSISPLWLRHWEHLITIFDYPQDIRRVIYTTNAIESLNSVIRKAIKNRRIFPSDRSALKVVFLAIEQAAKKWTMPVTDWKQALNRFAIQFEKRMPQESGPEGIYTKILTGSGKPRDVVVCSSPGISSLRIQCSHDVEQLSDALQHRGVTPMAFESPPFTSFPTLTRTPPGTAAGGLAMMDGGILQEGFQNWEAWRLIFLEMASPVFHSTDFAPIRNFP